jgi:hypothetical protein
MKCLPSIFLFKRTTYKLGYSLEKTVIIRLLLQRESSRSNNEPIWLSVSLAMVAGDGGQWPHPSCFFDYMFRYRILCYTTLEKKFSFLLLPSYIRTLFSAGRVHVVKKYFFMGRYLLLGYTHTTCVESSPLTVYMCVLCLQTHL